MAVLQLTGADRPIARAQAANRVNFNQPEEEFIDGDDVIGLGVLGKEGSGRLRMQARPNKRAPASSQE